MVTAIMDVRQLALVHAPVVQGNLRLHPSEIWGMQSFNFIIKKIMDTKELQTRREFFKQAALSSLPIISMAVLPTFFSGCEENSPSSGGSSSSTGCNAKCSSNCSAVCRNQCESNAKWRPSNCTGSSCKGSCWSSCKNTCKSTSKI